jgi:hypothetical protein
MRLSVLDQSPIRKGGTPADAVRETLELAQLCDRLGYTHWGEGRKTSPVWSERF